MASSSKRSSCVIEVLEMRRLLDGLMGPLPYGEPAVAVSRPAEVTPSAAGAATGYTVRIKQRAFSGTGSKVEILPVPAGSTFPTGTRMVLSPSDGSTATTITPDADGGADYWFTPTKAGSFILGFSNPNGLANAAPLPMTVHPGANPGTHIAPPRTGGTQFANPGNEYINGIINVHRRSRNIFFPGEAVQFLIPGQWNYGFNVPLTVNGYEVRNFEGKVVDAGSVVHTSARHAVLTLNVSEPGWYRLSLYESSRNHAVTGDAVGEALFSIWEPSSTLPNPGMTSYDNAADFPSSVAPQVKREELNAPFTAAVDPIYIRKSGKLIPPSSGTWFIEPPFGVNARLTINGTSVFDQWSRHYGTTTPSSIELTAGQEYDFTYEAYLAPAAAFPQLHWRKEGMSSALIPASSTRDDAGLLGGVTARYQTGYFSAEGANDQYLRALTGNAMGTQRIGVVKGKTFADYRPEIKVFKDLQLNRDPNRPKLRIDIAFPDYGTANSHTPAEVTRFVQDLLNFGLTPDDFVVECTNEPNFWISGSGFATTVLPGFYNAVKAANPAVRVIGPATVALQPGDLAWIEQFIDAGGAAYLDGFSFHHYNGTQGDFDTARKSLGGLKTLLANKGLDHLELYQTEQGDFTAMYGLFAMRHGVRWTMTRALIYEQEGLPMERNHYWYDRSHGFWDFPMFLNNGYGGLMPQATAFRVYGNELFGKSHAQKFSFGGTLDNIYAGSLFSGPSGSVAMFMTAGDAEGKVLLNVSGAASLTTVSWEGKLSTLAVNNGRALLPVSDFPVYVRVPNGAGISVVRENIGANLARSATAVASSGQADVVNINDGEFENWYHGFGERVWTSSTNMALEDGWVELKWDAPQRINRVNVFAPSMWQGESSMLDYELQYHNGANWVALDHVVEPIAVVPAYQMGSRSTVDDYSRNRNIFQHTFGEITTDRIRVLCHIATYGGASVKTVFEAGGQAWDPPRLMIRELEAYNVGGQKQWIGPDGSAWSNPANWSPTGVPAASNVAFIENGHVRLDATVRIAGLEISDSAWLDLNGHDLVIDYDTPGRLETWDGTQYTGASGMIARGALRNSQVGFAKYPAAVEAADALKLIGTQTALWSGQAVDGSSVLIRCTYAGDADLDGLISVDDYGRIDSNLGLAFFGWGNGDFNLDGTIDIDDYGMIDASAIATR